MAVRQVAGLQLHGTGTSLGDPIEVGAAAGEQISMIMLCVLLGRQAGCFIPLPLWN